MQSMQERCRLEQVLKYSIDYRICRLRKQEKKEVRRTEPWGTSAFTCLDKDLAEPTLTDCCLCDR